MDKRYELTPEQFEVIRDLLCDTALGHSSRHFDCRPGRRKPSFSVGIAATRRKKPHNQVERTSMKLVPVEGLEPPRP
jgi:hypothetical protein